MCDEIPAINRTPTIFMFVGGCVWREVRDSLFLEEERAYYCKQDPSHCPLVLLLRLCFLVLINEMLKRGANLGENVKMTRT
jgi:hypothetical protein